jgi:hypothetical protein
MTYLLKSPHTAPNIGNINENIEFYMTDEKKLFDKNIKYLQGWIYAEKQITYKLNSFGYRMNKELAEIDYDNYFAFFGCSNTVGIGLALEDTFSYKIAKQSNVDYINGAIGGASVDFVFYNLVTLFNTAPKLPKTVIIYWPDPIRTCYWFKNSLVFYLTTSTPHHTTHWDEAYKSFILEPSHIVNRFIIYRSVITQLCKANNVTLFEFTSDYLKYEFFDKHGIDILSVKDVPIENDYASLIDWINDAYARDVHLDGSYLPKVVPTPSAHPGIFQQDYITSTFFNTVGVKF